MRLITGLAILAVLAGCTSTTPPVQQPPEKVPFAACASLPVAQQVSSVPDLALSCFAGGDTVHTGRLRGPMVLNFWASWCLPCRDELPAFQRLADSGKIPVVGINSNDRRSAAISLAEGLDVRFPTLFDPDGNLKNEFGAIGLPLTVLIAADGKTTVHTVPPLTDETLAEFVKAAAL